MSFDASRAILSLRGTENRGGRSPFLRRFAPSASLALAAPPSPLSSCRPHIITSRQGRRRDMRRPLTLAVVLALIPFLFMLACGDSTRPTAPTPTPTPTPLPTPTPTPDLSHLVGMWNITVSVTAADAGSAGGCVAETMQSRIGVPSRYALSITSNGAVTLASASGDYACTFPTVKADGSSFTTYGVAGYFSCRDEVQIRCDDGTVHRLFIPGQDIAGRVSGTEITGTWDAFWLDWDHSSSGVATKAQFTGSR
jgi:hypothetical protein